MSHIDNIILGIDIGSYNISAIIAEIGPDQHIHLLGKGSSISAGIEHGKIYDETRCQNAIRKAYERAQASANTPAGALISTIPAADINIGPFKTRLLNPHPQGRISEALSLRAYEKLQNIPENHHLLHGIPHYFRVDGEKTQQPTGMRGTHLEIIGQHIYCNNAKIQRLLRCLAPLEMPIKSLVYDPLAKYHSLPDSPSDKDLLLLDWGGEFCKLSHFRGDTLVNSQKIPLGGNTITRDIAHCLNISIPEAENLKIIYGNALPSSKKTGEYVEIMTPKGRQELAQRHLCQIIEARVEECSKLLKSKIGPIFNTLDHLHLTGGGAQLHGLAEFFQNRLQKKAILCGNYEHDGALGSLYFARHNRALNVAPHPKPSWRKSPLKSLVANPAL